MNESSDLHAVGGVRLNLTEEQAETIQLLIGMYMAQLRWQSRPIPERVQSLHDAVQGVR